MPFVTITEISPSQTRVSWILCKRRLITAEASSPQTE
jgi:hypothetical protein